MRSARLLTLSRIIHMGRVCVPREAVCLTWGRGLPAYLGGGGHLLEEFVLPRASACPMLLREGTLPVTRMTEACGNITFPILRMRVILIPVIDKTTRQ